MARKPESNFKDIVRKDLESLSGIWFTKVQQVSIRGIPDFLCCYRGRFIALELKKDRKSKIDALQSYAISRIDWCGGYARVVSPETWKDVFEEIKALAS